jgi:hypothetical protein
MAQNILQMTFPNFPIDWINTGGLHLDEYFTRAKSWDRYIFIFEYTRITVAGVSLNIGSELLREATQVEGSRDWLREGRVRRAAELFTRSF